MLEKSKRLNWIDWAKALGIFSVVLGHIYYPDNYKFIYSFIYGFHMPFFFLISGYLHKQEKGYLKKNIKRLIVPYLSYNILLMLIFYAPRAFVFNTSTVEVSFLFKNLILGIDPLFSSPSWFLLALFWAKIANSMILNLKFTYSIVLSILLGISGYVIYHYIDVQIPYFICQGLLATPIITIGYCIKKKNIVERMFIKKKMIAYSCVIIFPIYLFLTQTLEPLDLVYCYYTDNPLEGMIMACLGSFLFFVFCRTLNEYSNKFILKISEGTILILCLHYKMYLVIIRFIGNLDIYISVIICCLIILCCYLLICYIQKSKILSFLFLGRDYK